jgi:hypothetical protein
MGFCSTSNQMVSAAVTTQPAFAIREQHVLFTLPADVRLNPSRQFYDVSLDDRRFLMVRSGGALTANTDRAPLIVVDHWFEELKARMNARR